MTALLHLLTALAAAVWPLQPQPSVVHGFDPPEAAWAAGHRGVDLLGRAGQAVRSTLPGTVAYVGTIAGRGVVVVSHGSRRTTYEPVGGSVRAGEPVLAGQRIGTLEYGGSHCLPRACLHWGLIEGRDHYLDPLSLLGCEPRPVRLWPVEPARPVGAPAGRPCATGPW